MNLMKRLFILFFLFPLFTESQIIKLNDKEVDPDKSTIEKNIFRAIFSAATDTKLSLVGSYEREILKPVTLFLKAGPAFNRVYDSTDAFGEKQYEWIFNLIGSAEVRYYFNLKRRTKHQKTTKNFTACYFGVEELLRSSSLFILNKAGNEKIAGLNAPFINVGYQNQFNRTYYHIFFGARFPGKVYSNSVTVFDLLHLGVAIGRVF